MESSIWVVVHYDEHGLRAADHSLTEDSLYEDGWFVDFIGQELNAAINAYLEFDEANSGERQFYLGKLELVNPE